MVWWLTRSTGPEPLMASLEKLFLSLKLSSKINLFDFQCQRVWHNLLRENCKIPLFFLFTVGPLSMICQGRHVSVNISIWNYPVDRERMWLKAQHTFCTIDYEQDRTDHVWVMVYFCHVLFLTLLDVCGSEGTWTITAKFDHWQQNTFTSRFEVKKYGRSCSIVLQ